MPSISEPEPLDESPAKLALRVLALRLRFLVAIGMFALSMVCWPWLRTAWDRWVMARIIGSTDYAVSADSEFFCPMDPGVITAWPAICPICNMDLIARKKVDAQLLPEGVLARMQLSPYRVQLAGVRTDAVQTVGPEQALTVPETAVVHRDSGPIVYVETMKGMFDAIPVKLGSRAGDQYVVLSGLKSGQRVVSIGAFLIDAETRLSPGAATQYFGANQHHASSTPPLLAPKRTATALTSLSDADQRLVSVQAVCPVTNAPLGSMGQPVFVTVDGQRIALCCKGCEGRLLANKEKYLEALKASKAADSTVP